MPQADFTGEYSSNGNRSTYPKLKLQTNERARVCVITKPHVEYLHWLEAPKIVNMSPVYKKITDRDQNVQWVPETRMVDRAICPGTFETLRERGVDEAHCDACRMARERPDIFRPPNTRYASTIIRYSLRPNGGWNDLTVPFSMGALVWAFSGKVFDKLRNIQTMGPGYEDIRAVDLCLECTDQNFQKPYSQGEFQALTPAVWMLNDQMRDYTVKFLEQNQAAEADLLDAIGKRLKPDWMADDLLRITQAWDVVRAYESRQQGGPALGQGFGAESFGQGMQNLQQQSQGWSPGGNGQPTAGQGGGGAGQGGGGSWIGNGGSGGGSGWNPNQGGPALGQGGGGAGTNGFQPGPVQSAGVDMSLLNGQRLQQSVPPPPAPTGLEGIEQFRQPNPVPPGPIANMPAEASQRADALYAAAQQAPPQREQTPFTQLAAAELAQNPIPNPVADAFTQFQAQQAAPAPQPSQQAPSPTLAAVAPQGVSALPSPAVAAPAMTGTVPPSSQPVPDGLSGLAEFMASRTSNPTLTPLPAAPPSPGAAPAEAKRFSFEDLKQLADGK